MVEPSGTALRICGRLAGQIKASQTLRPQAENDGGTAARVSMQRNERGVQCVAAV